MAKVAVDGDVVVTDEWKCFAIWWAETLCQVLLLMALLLLFAFVIEPGSIRKGVDWRDIASLLFAVMVFMVFSGYAFTTAIVGVFFRSQTPWLYPAIATLFFLVHFQLLQFLGNSWKWTRPEAPVVLLLAGGASIAFGCTFVGGWVLRKWTTGGFP